MARMEWMAAKERDRAQRGKAVGKGFINRRLPSQIYADFPVGRNPDELEPF